MVLGVSTLNTTFTQRKELEAVSIGERFAHELRSAHPGREIRRDARIWNNPRWMFDHPEKGKVALVGVHIGGTPGIVTSAYRGSDADWHKCDLVRSPSHPCNEWVCGCWDEAGITAQGKMIEVFNALFGCAIGRQVLLETRSFDVCPVRIHKEKDIPRSVWLDSKSWFYSILEYLQPSLIICNRNAEPGSSIKSAWNALYDHPVYNLERVRCDAPIHGNGYLKCARIRGGNLQGAKVIGLPQLTRWGTDVLWSELTTLGKELRTR